MVREFFLLATGKAYLFLFMFPTYFLITIGSESSIVTVGAHF